MKATPQTKKDKKTDKLCVNQYNERYKEAEKTLKDMLTKIKQHKKEFKQSGSTNWGYVGDMGYIAEKLQAIEN
jgi:hypothetical protein